MSIFELIKKLPIKAHEFEAYETLWTNGDYVQLADELSTNNHFELAAKIYEQAFDFQKAFIAYKDGHLWQQLCRITVVSQDKQLHPELLNVLMAHQKTHEALTWIPKTSHELRALFLEQVQNYEEAATHYKECGLWLKAIACYIKANSPAAAGAIYERLLLSNPQESTLIIPYCRILMELGQFDQALKKLQPICEREGFTPSQEIFPLLTICFLALNLKTSAQTTLMRWHQLDDSEDAPEDLGDFLTWPLSEHYLSTKQDRNDQQENIILNGRYILTQTIETNATNEIWLGLDRLTASTVIIEILEKTYLSTNGFANFINDLTAMQTTHIAGIAEYLDISPHQSFLVKKPHRGTTLKEYLNSNDTQNFRHYFYRLLDIIENCHHEGWLHTQLNLTNIFVSARQVIVDGWGYRHLKSQLQTRTTGEDSPWLFCAPEIFHGGAYDQRADVFSLIALLEYFFKHQNLFALMPNDKRVTWEHFFQKNNSTELKKRIQSIKELREKIPKWPSAKLLSDFKHQHSKPNLNPISSVAKETLVQKYNEYTLYLSSHPILNRNEFIVKCSSVTISERLYPWANIKRGVQPIYRWHPTKPQFYIAPGPSQKASLQSIKRFPYSMTRDLAAVAFALEMLHENNLSLNGFSVDRALGSYGPELQLIPGQLPQSSNSNNCNEDYESLVELIASCFCVEKAELWLGLVQDLRKTGHLTYSECKDLKKQWPNSISTWGHALTTLCELLVENKSSNFVTYFKNELRLEN